MKLETSEGTPHFEMKDAYDLLEKARYDLKLFEAHATSYDLFNFIHDLTHIYDWIVKDNQFSSDIRNAGDYLKHYDREAILIRQLCNRAKHFEKRTASPTTIHRPGDDSLFLLLGIPLKTHDSYSVVDASNELDILPLCRSVFKKWEAVLERSIV